MTDKHTDQESERARMATVVLLAVLASSGCAAQLSTDRLADATSRQCEIGVDSGDLAMDEAAMLAIIEESGRKIVTRKRGEGYTVLPRRVLFPRNYDERSAESKVSSLEHELVHVCQQGEARVVWVIDYGVDPDFRLEVEVGGIVAQAARICSLGGDGEALIRRQVGRLPDVHRVKVDEQWSGAVLIPAMVQAACPDVALSTSAGHSAGADAGSDAGSGDSDD